MTASARRRLLIALGLSAAVPSTAFCALSLTTTAQPRFGIVTSGPSGRQFILNPDGTVSGASAGDYVSGAAEGRLVIQDTSSPATLNISVMVFGSTGGVTVNEVLCSYNGGLPGVCSGGGMTVISAATATLRIGLDVTTTTPHAGGDTASATLEVTVSYL